MKPLLLLPLFILTLQLHAQTYFTRRQALEDIDHYNRVLENVHYNPYLFITRENYQKHVSGIRQEIGDSVSLQDFIILMYRITAVLKDGHTNPGIFQPALSDEFRKEQFFPYRLVKEEGRLYFPRSVSDSLHIPVGSEILTVNGKNMAQLVPLLDTYIGGNKNYSEEMATRLFSYFLFLNGIKAPFEISYQTAEGKNDTLKTEKGSSFMYALAETIPGIRKAYYFKVIDDKLGYFNFMSMSGDMNALDQYFDSCITLLKTKNIGHLAIDLRDNSGGNSILGDLLISYFNTGKYTLMGSRIWKVSEEYKEQLRLWGDTASNYLSMQTGSAWELGNCEPQDPIFQNNNIYPGKIYIITGPFTFSSANMIADGVKTYKLATLIGEPTGENTNDFGEVYEFELPHSKLKMRTTTSFDYGTNCDKNSHTPVTPDKLITPSLKDKIAEKDIVLEFLLKSIP